MKNEINIGELNIGDVLIWDGNIDDTEPEFFEIESFNRTSHGPYFDSKKTIHGSSYFIFQEDGSESKVKRIIWEEMEDELKRRWRYPTKEELDLFKLYKIT